MTINFYNHSCFKAQSGDIVLAFDPPSKASGLKTPRFQTDIILISHNHKDHNGADVLTLKENNPHFIIDNPGEYEIKGAVINGIRSFHDSKEGSELGYGASVSAAYRPWDEDDDAELRELYLGGATIPSLAKVFSRTSGSIRSRLKKNNLIEKK